MTSFISRVNQNNLFCGLGAGLGAVAITLDPLAAGTAGFAFSTTYDVVDKCTNLALNFFKDKGFISKNNASKCYNVSRVFSNAAGFASGVAFYGFVVANPYRRGIAITLLAVSGVFFALGYGAREISKVKQQVS